MSSVYLQKSLGSGMIHRPAVLLFALLSFPALLAAQPADTAPAGALRFLPGIPVSPRFTADPEEARSGIMKEFGTSRLKLDVGIAYDLLEWRTRNNSTRSLRLGTELFTYALVMNANGRRLQADAADAFIGGHLLYTQRIDRGLAALRLRILHLSAHFLDGHQSADGNLWREGREPIPFSRDYGELTHLWRRMTTRGHFQIYGGIAYATLIRPVEINRWSFLAGGEYADAKLAGSVLGQPAHCYAAFHFTLAGIPAWIGTTHLEGGLRLGDWDRAGVRLYVNYQAGLDVFHQYYNVRGESWGGGIAFDLW